MNVLMALWLCVPCIRFHLSQERGKWRKECYEDICYGVHRCMRALRLLKTKKRNTFTELSSAGRKWKPRERTFSWNKFSEFFMLFMFVGRRRLRVSAKFREMKTESADLAANSVALFGDIGEGSLWLNHRTSPSRFSHFFSCSSLLLFIINLSPTAWCFFSVCNQLRNYLISWRTRCLLLKGHSDFASVLYLKNIFMRMGNRRRHV